MPILSHRCPRIDRRLPFGGLLLSLTILTTLFACRAATEAELPDTKRVVGGDWRSGRAMVETLECGACHRIPAVPGAKGRVGPSLAGFAQRTYIAGSIPNRPGLLVSWIVDPPAMLPTTAMPNMGITETEARDIAAFLYRLR